MSGLLKESKRITSRFMDNFKLDIGKNGSIKLPYELRAKYKIRTGDWLWFVPIEGNLVFLPMTTSVSELARDIESARLKTGWKTSQGINGLRQQRKRYFAEKYKRPNER